MKLANIVDWFAAFLRGRRWYHHFRRLPLWESVGRSAAASSSPPPALTAALRAAASDPPADVLARLGSDASGLDAAQVRAQFARYGPNAVVSEPPLSWVAHLWRCY
ncbi:MAG TPA: magnesium-translocating P-type ATPase, partial [Armatimonadetes bacterium]|nr:magnesium-translocating P-type ATPase [Armatimonadota bacterium]